MKKRLLVTTVYFSVLLLIFGCAAQTKLADYQPKSAEEKEVLDNVVTFDKAIQNRNSAELMACIHDNATIRVPLAELVGPLVSKRQFEEYLEDGGWGEFTGILVNPTITTRGDKATLKCSSQGTGVRVKHTFNLIKENEKWYVIKYDFIW